MKLEYPNVNFIKVNTLQAIEIKEQHANEQAKPYFKFYKNGQILDEVPYEVKWEAQEPKVLEIIKKHSEEYKPDPVRHLINLQQFEKTIIEAEGRVLAV